MKLITMQDEKIWSAFVLDNKGAAGSEFLLSPEWTEVVKGEYNEVKCLAIVDDLSLNDVSKISASEILVLIIISRRNLGRGFFYWYAPRGPLLQSGLSKEKSAEAIKFLLRAIKRLNQKALFLKVEPASADEDFWRSVFPSRSLSGIFRVRRASDIQPRETLVLDLKKTDDELLSAMHQKTRYNIRLAQKKGVKIIEGRPDDFEEFWRLMAITGGRDGFRLHDKEHYQLLASLEKENIPGKPEFIRIFFAEHEGKKIATAMLSFWGGRATYLHGGSDNDFREVMAPYLLQWEMIVRAKQEGASLYDFYGISDKKWPGVTRFKRGFGGEERVYPGVFDIVFRVSMYRCYRLIKLVKAVIKGK